MTHQIVEYDTGGFLVLLDSGKDAEEEAEEYHEKPAAAAASKMKTTNKHIRRMTTWHKTRNNDNTKTVRVYHNG